jgi:hypothetical protein
VPSSNRRRVALALAALLPCSLAALPASGQDALGDGRALDNSLSTRGRYNQGRPSLRSEFAFRNSVVTGNAPSGMSFRGDVGYRAPGEFSGELGSNDLFSFRRESLQSGIAGMGIRGTEALQYQMALTTGSRPPSNLVGQFSISRSGTTPSAGGIRTLNNPADAGGLQQRPSIDPDADERGTMLWMLRSPSAYISNSSLQTSALRRVESEKGVYTLTASPLRGVRLSPLPELTAQRRAARDAAELAEQEPSFGSASRANTPATPEAPGASTDKPDQIGTLHSDMLGRLRTLDDASRTQDVFEAGPSLAERMETMLKRLSGQDSASDVEVAEEGTDGTRSRRVQFDAETMRMLRGDGTRLNRFVDPDAASRDVYAEHLQAGQELLAEGRYFDAEERFASALGIRRGDVTAQIGRLHAQIGAGLYLSASLNLQSLAASRPEVFAAKYGAGLMPETERLDEVIRVMREMIDGSTDMSKRSSPQVRQAAGLLLGYVGYQLDRPDLVKEGMADFRTRVRRGLAAGDPLPIEARLGDLLNTMWTVDETGAEGGDG